MVKILVELVEFASYHFRIVRNLTFPPLDHGWISWIEVYLIISSNKIISSHLRGGSAILGWIRFRSLYDLKLLEISCSRCAQIRVELVDLRYTLYNMSIWHYQAILYGVVQILVELVELATYILHFIGLDFSANMSMHVMVELVELRFSTSLLLIWHYLAILDAVVKILVEFVELASDRSICRRCAQIMVEFMNWGIHHDICQHDNI